MYLESYFLSAFIRLSVYTRQHINLIKGVSTPLKYLEVLKAHFSFKFPIARTNCWAKVRFSGKKVKRLLDSCARIAFFGEKNENDRSVVTVNTVALT